VRVYLPPDANCLALRHGPLPAQPSLCERRDRRQASRAAVADDGRGREALHEGIGIWRGRATIRRPRQTWDGLLRRRATLETLAAVSIMREHLPELRIRVVNVVDLMKLQPTTEHRTA